MSTETVWYEFETENKKVQSGIIIKFGGDTIQASLNNRIYIDR